MVPKIPGNGKSFKGAAAYYLHDKNADTRERVAWTHTENVLTRDPEKAAKVMAFTALNQAELKREAGVPATGRKLQKPVFTMSLAWHPDQDPDRDHMLATARDAVKSLGLQEHEAIYVAHNDQPQKHVHVMVNRVHPRTGKAAKLSRSKERLSEWALKYEKEHGPIYCERRVENVKARARGNPTKYRDPAIAYAWRRSDSGKAFQAALAEEGYRLAEGNKRPVVVDPWGKAHNPTRHIEGVRARDIKARLSDLDRNKLPKADELQQQIRSERAEAESAKTRHEEWAAWFMNKTRDRHFEERAQLNTKYQRRIRAKRKELAEFYELKKVKARIKELRQQTKETPGMLTRLTGRSAAARKELANMERQLSDIRQRTQEQVGKIEREWEQAVEQQQKRHEQETEKTREHVERGKSEFTGREPERAKEKDKDKDKDQDRGRGRERERGPRNNGQ